MKFCTDYGIIKSGVVNSALDYLEEHPGIQSFVVGVSGGVDSALVIALAREIAKVRPIRIIAASLPITTNKPDEIERASMVGAAFADQFIEKNMTIEFETLAMSMEPKAAGALAMNLRSMSVSDWATSRLACE